MPDFDIRAGDVIAGTPYRVIRLIGFGGMGSVYEVEHAELSKRFVLKALRRGLSSRRDLAQRLRNEWRALGRLEHPNIVSVTDAGVTPTGHPYFVMERLVGETLGERLKRGRPFGVLEALHVAVQILDGLYAAHGIGVIHRDIKPANVFLVDGGAVKLLDFGIAKTMDSGGHPITQRGVAIGTPRYMAPEQASGAKVDARTDLYAVGLVLYEMLTGQGPFDDIKDPNQLFLAHMGEDAPRMRSAERELPIELDDLVASALAKSPRSRPRSAAFMAAALRECASRLAARPSTPPLPEWIHLGATVPGSPVTESPLGVSADVTHTLVVGAAAPPEPAGTTQSHAAAQPPSARRDAGDGLASTQTMDPESGDPAGPDGGEAVTRTAESPDSLTNATAPPIEAEAHASGRSSRRRMTLAAVLTTIGLSTMILGAFVFGKLARDAAEQSRRPIAAPAAAAPAAPASVVIAPLEDPPGDESRVEETPTPAAEPTTPTSRSAAPAARRRPAVRVLPRPKATVAVVGSDDEQTTAPVASVRTIPESEPTAQTSGAGSVDAPIFPWSDRAAPVRAPAPAPRPPTRLDPSGLPASGL